MPQWHGPSENLTSIGPVGWVTSEAGSRDLPFAPPPLFVDIEYLLS